MSLEHGEKRWKVLGTEIVAKYRVFQIIEEKAVSPRTGDERVFHLVDRPACVQAIAHTADGRFVMVDFLTAGFAATASLRRETERLIKQIQVLLGEKD